MDKDEAEYLVRMIAGKVARAALTEALEGRCIHIKGKRRKY